MEKKKKKFTLFSDGWSSLRNQVQTPLFSPKTPLFSPKASKEKSISKTPELEVPKDLKKETVTPQETEAPQIDLPTPKIRTGKTPKEEYVSFMFKETEQLPNSPCLVDEKEKELEVFQGPKRELFKTYCMEKQLTDQFLFYELYQQYKKENDSSLKDSISEELKKEFIDPCGSHVITITASDFKKIQKYLMKDPLKGFQMIYRFVFFFKTKIGLF
jgi:hypothetical protein